MLQERRAAADRLARRERALSNGRLAVFVAGLVLAGFVFLGKLLPLAVLLVPLVLFTALVSIHGRVIEKRDGADRAVIFYQQGIARLEDRWAGTGPRGDQFADPSHPYALDLDLFGEGSLFQLLCTARTRGGEERLAGWLLAPATPEEVRARQEAVAELRPGLELREELAILGAEIRSGLDPDRLREWGSRPALSRLGALRIAALALSLLPIALAVLGFVAGIGYFGVPAAVALGLAFTLAVDRRIEPLIGASERSSRDLELFSHLLARLEREHFGCAHLAGLRAELDVDHRAPSRCIAALQKLQDLLDARRHQFFAPIALLLLWHIQIGLAIESWRIRHGRRLATWLDTVAELEALMAFAGYSFEHPEDPFAELAEGEPRFEGEEIGHPLLPVASCVRNDVTLGPELRLLVVSGSNMSGKSTLLRTVGTNAVLAQAGAPVRARRVVLTPLSVGASIRVNDSLQEGTSRFYAEIKRIARLLEMARAGAPLLFLLDEVLHGTNSHDRRIGAEAVALALVERGALGLLTTHDLALAKIVETPGSRAENVHFQDHLEDGRIHFDYRMRPGVVEKSNALELMRTVGIEV